MPESPQLWFNTLILFVCSATLQWTRVVLKQEKRNKVKFGMLLGGVLTLCFVLGQLLVWREMSAQGYYLASNPANSFFYVLTGLHGIHLIGGLWVWARAFIKVMLGHKLRDIRVSVELCAVYWHFLLLVWLVLFVLLSYT